VKVYVVKIQMEPKYTNVCVRFKREFIKTLIVINDGSCGNRVFLRTLFLHKNENKILTLHEAYFFHLHLIQT